MYVSQWVIHTWALVLTIYTNHPGGNIMHKHKTIKFEQRKEVRLILQKGIYMYIYIFRVTNISELGVSFLFQGLIRSVIRVRDTDLSFV